MFLFPAWNMATPAYPGDPVGGPQRVVNPLFSVWRPPSSVLRTGPRRASANSLCNEDCWGGAAKAVTLWPIAAWIEVFISSQKRGCRTGLSHSGPPSRRPPSSFVAQNRPGGPEKCKNRSQEEPNQAGKSYNMYRRGRPGGLSRTRRLGKPDEIIDVFPFVLYHLRAVAVAGASGRLGWAFCDAGAGSEKNFDFFVFSA